MAGDEGYQSLRSFLRSFTKENASRFLLFHSLRRTRRCFALQNWGFKILLPKTRKKMSKYSSFFLAGDEGFEPPITGPEPVALPLGQSPICLVSFMSLRTCFIMFWSRTGLIIVYSVEGPRTAVALPLGQSPICLVSFMSLRTCFVMFWYRMVLTIIYSVEGPRTTVAFA